MQVMKLIFSENFLVDVRLRGTISRIELDIISVDRASRTELRLNEAFASKLLEK